MRLVASHGCTGTWALLGTGQHGGVEGAQALPLPRDSTANHQQPVNNLPSSSSLQISNQSIAALPHQ